MLFIYNVVNINKKRKVFFTRKTKRRIDFFLKLWHNDNTICVIVPIYRIFIC